jgi:hypothetical protein
LRVGLGTSRTLARASAALRTSSTVCVEAAAGTPDRKYHCLGLCGSAGRAPRRARVEPYCTINTREGFFRDAATVVREQVQAVMGLPGRSLAVLRRGVYFLFHNARRALKALVVVVVVGVKAGVRVFHFGVDDYYFN